MSEPVPVRVPQINPNDEHAVVVRWHVAKGSRVRAGQTLVTLETTKTTFDVDAPADGYAFFEHEKPDVLVHVGTPHAPAALAHFCSALEAGVEALARVESVAGLTPLTRGARGVAEKWDALRGALS